jgi:hypothetical protein
MAALLLKEPLVTDAVSSETFDEIWLAEFSVNASDPDKVNIEATIIPAKTVDGKKVLSKVGGKRFGIEDFFSTATQDEMVVMYSLINLLKTRADV